MLREGTYTVADAVKDYLAEITAEKSPLRSKVPSTCSTPGSCRTSAPSRSRSSPRIASTGGATGSPPNPSASARSDRDGARDPGDPDNEDARRARKATANRILTMLKAALNRAFHADRVSSDTAWRKVKPFRRSTRPWSAISAPPRRAGWSGPAPRISEAGAGRPAHRLPLLRARPPEMRQFQPRQRHAGDPAQQGQNSPRRADRRGQAVLCGVDHKTGSADHVFLRADERLGCLAPEAAAGRGERPAPGSRRR